MRNTLQYPVTVEEMVNCLHRLRNDANTKNKEQLIMGDMTSLLLSKTIVVLEAVAQQPEVKAILES